MKNVMEQMELKEKISPIFKIKFLSFDDLFMKSFYENIIPLRRQFLNLNLIANKFSIKFFIRNWISRFNQIIFQ